MLFLYNILFPLGFIFFIPSIIYKLIRRGGDKRSYPERFAFFSPCKKRLLQDCEGAIWVHSVSVGETIVAISMIKKWKFTSPHLKFVLSTTTTTGQALARLKAPEGVTVIFCPLDFILFVRKTVKLIRPSLLVIFETEIWPNLIGEVYRSKAKIVLVNARISHKSSENYRRFRWFFTPILKKMSLICAQTEQDKERFNAICPGLPLYVCGNMKFDQEIPENLPEIDLQQYFGSGTHLVLLAASTHAGEEKLIAETFCNLQKKFPELRLIIIPRHAERGGEISSVLASMRLPFLRRSLNAKFEKDGTDVLVLLADTTGEVLSFMNKADIVIMGKSFAGHDEGHNLIEPALLGKAIITGSVVRNFHFVLNALLEMGALVAVDSDDGLENAIVKLIENKGLRRQLGDKAKWAAVCHKGATEKTIKFLEGII